MMHPEDSDFFKKGHSPIILTLAQCNLKDAPKVIFENSMKKRVKEPSSSHETEPKRNWHLTTMLTGPVSNRFYNKGSKNSS